MNRLHPGMLIKTNYSGPYRIVSIERGCTCPTYTDELDMDDPPDQPPHIHMVLTSPDGTGRYYLCHWDEDTLLSLEKSYCGFKQVADYDQIVILPADKPVQLTLF